VARDLEVTRAQRRVTLDHIGNLLEDLLAIGFERVLSRVKEDVTWQLDYHPVVAHHDLQAHARKFIEASLEVAKTRFHVIKLFESSLIF
jgi:hypothetical protein